MEPLPPRQSALLDFLWEYREANDRVPSITDICAHFGFGSPTAAVDLLNKLQAKGAIQREPGLRRSIRLLRQASKPRTDQLPLLGRIAAGVPITAGEHVAEYLPIPASLFSPKADLLFRVTGQSMVNAGIQNADLVGVHLQDEVRNGQIVAAVVIDPHTDDPELTLKTYRRRGSTITLLAENDDQILYQPLIFDVRRDHIQIVGVYCGLIRTEAP